MNTYLLSNLVFNEIEYYSYLNLWLIILFLLFTMYFILLNSCLLFYSTIYFNHSLIELYITFLSLIILLFIISPSLIILLDYDIVLIPEFLIYTLGYQWAWNLNIVNFFNHNYNIYIDQYVVNPKIHSNIYNTDSINTASEELYWYWERFLDRSNDNLSFPADFSWPYNIFDLPYILKLFTGSYMISIIGVYPKEIILCHYGCLLTYIALEYSWENHLKCHVTDLCNRVVDSVNRTVVGDLYNLNKDMGLQVQYWINEPTRTLSNNNSLLIPCYSIIKIFLLSYDVIHSIGFYSLGVKMDAIPARINVTQSLRTLFKGEYRGFCFELCGQGHSAMVLTGVLMTYLNKYKIKY